MADIYSVHFKVGMEPSTAKFEFEEHAVALAESLDGLPVCKDVAVTDMERNEVWP